MKKKLMLIMGGVLAALQLAAMPTAEEQKNAAPIVAELMNPLVADFKTNKKTATEVGDMAMGYVKEASTEAAKYLLMKGAIWYFAQANEDAKCIATLAALGEQVKNIPPEVMRNEVIKPALDRLSEQNVPRLLAQYRLLSAQMEIAKLKPSVRRKRADASTCRRYAELLVVTGDWRAALAVFAKLGDAKMAQVVKDEIDGKGLASAGDFWWEYKPTENAAADAVKTHAAALYRKSIASGELTGLKKVVAEKRIASAPPTDSLDVSAAPRGGTPSNALYCVIDLSAGPDASNYPVKWLDTPPSGGFNTDEYKTTKLVLRRIEPGKFKMLDKYDVTITKPYYIAEFVITERQFKLVTDMNPSLVTTKGAASVSWNAARGESRIHNWPTVRTVDPKSFIGLIRKRTGLMFDLPTDAQWDFAFRTHKMTNLLHAHEEWCLDLWRESQFLQEGAVDPEGERQMMRDAPFEQRVLRRGNVRTKAGPTSVKWGKDNLSYRVIRLCINPEVPVGSTSPRGSDAPIASQTQAANALYCVIDLSAGPNASKYPVTGFDTPPSGGFNTDEYKTTKLALRRIDPGTFIMGNDQNDESHRVKITKRFYCGIFEMTQKQYGLVMGSNPSKHKGDMRPVEQVSWNTIRGDSATCNWPSSANADPDSFMGKLQARTGLNFDLPTEAQWEYACRAGTTSKFNNGGDTEDDMKKSGRYKDNHDGPGGYDQHTTVGSYLPNAWGLYDMHGNIWEWCLDRDGNPSGGVADPSGSSSAAHRVLRGGCWYNYTGNCASSSRNASDPSEENNGRGFRLFRTLSN